MVVANAVAALSEINESSPSGKPLIEMNPQTINKLLTALNECTEWGQGRGNSGIVLRQIRQFFKKPISVRWPYKIMVNSISSYSERIRSFFVKNKLN